MPSSTLSVESAAERKWDALILGAGPAGALAAHQVARGGARVLLVEKRTFPRWKVCGACLNGQALSALDRAGLGTLVADADAVPLNRFRLGFQGRESRFAMPVGRAVSRSRLDSDLVDAAIEAGAEFLGETSGRVLPVQGERRAVELEQGTGRVSVQASVVLVAAGLGNRCVEGEARISTRIQRRARVGAGCVVDRFPESYDAGAIHMAVGRKGYVGLVRVEDGSLNVAAAFDRAFLKQSNGPASAAAHVLEEAGFAPIDSLTQAHWQGTPGLTRSTRPVASERLFLIGDATGYVEPFTGEGMGWGLTSAHAVAPLVLRGVDRWTTSLEKDWIHLHQRIIGRRQSLCRFLAQVLRYPLLAGLTLGVAVRIPRVSSWMMDQLNRPPALSQPI